MSYPTDRKYTKEHEWIQVNGNNAVVGITDYAQQSLGDIVFVETPKVGAELAAGKTLGTVESVKAVSDLYAPASGTVTEVNGELATAPEKINKDANHTWMLKMTLKNPGELNSLLSAADREAMLKAIGARSIDDLFSPIPAEYRLNRDLKVPRQMAESEIVEWFRERSRENGDGYASFLGAGAYFHYRPVIIDSLISRGEFLTAYTPYQAEISQGTLQSIFEFQTMICELTGMEVANASMYDGSTAA